MHLIDYVAVVSFFVLMVVIGLQYSRSSASFSDYVRMGSRSTWWLTGSSIFMMTFSSITFTGIAGSAYVAGWSVLIIFWGNALNLLVQAFYFAPLMRRTRADTANDAVRMRFGRPVEQFISYFSTFSSFVWGGTFLLSLATFLTTILGLPLWLLILIVGFVVVTYSVSGGQWGVQVTDFLQALVLMAVTFAFSLICLYHLGGLSGLFDAIKEAELTSDFAIFKPSDHTYSSDLHVQAGMFTLLWGLGIGLKSLTEAANIQSCSRYLAVSDEKGARKAAVLAAVLMLIGSVIWFIPPMFARLFLESDVMAVEGLGNHADAAYAVAAMKVLPPGFLGLIVVAMIAATMSSMDSFLTGSAGVIVKNIYIPLVEALGKKPKEGKALLNLVRWVNLGLGIWSIVMAFILKSLSGTSGIFGIVMKVFALVAPPLVVPLALGLIFRRYSSWGFFFAVTCGVATSITMFVLSSRGAVIPWHMQLFAVSFGAGVPAILSMLFWKKSSEPERTRIDSFFTTIKTPIDVTKEVGARMDRDFLFRVSTYLFVVSAAILLLAFWSSDRIDLMAIAGVSGFLAGIATLMRWAARRSA